MRRRTLLFGLSIMLWGGSMFADTEQTVTVNGTPVSRFVTGLAFSGDNVTMTFDDNTTQTEDMSLVNIVLNYGTSGIESVQVADKVTDGKVYSISGQYVGNTTKGLQKGIYIVNGKKIVIK